jgi:hypothetical protein
VPLAQWLNKQSKGREMQLVKMFLRGRKMSGRHGQAAESIAEWPFYFLQKSNIYQPFLLTVEFFLLLIFKQEAKNSIEQIKQLFRRCFFLKKSSHSSHIYLP